MKKLLIASALAAVSFTTVATAQDFEQYVSAKGVLAHVNNKFEDEEGHFKENKNVGGIRLAYGVIVPMADNNLRAELEYGYNGKVKINEDGDFSEMKSQTLMANAYFDFNTGSNWTPYVGAGIGYARLKNTLGYTGNEGYSISKSKGNFAWNVSVGTTYAIDKNLALDVSYRFADYGKVTHKFEDQTEGKVKQRANEFSLGVRYSF